jgi:hypothetical protein
MPDFIGELKKMLDEKLIDKNTKLMLIKKHFMIVFMRSY